MDTRDRFIFLALLFWQYESKRCFPRDQFDLQLVWRSNQLCVRLRLKRKIEEILLRLIDARTDQCLTFTRAHVSKCIQQIFIVFSPHCAWLMGDKNLCVCEAFLLSQGTFILDRETHGITLRCIWPSLIFIPFLICTDVRIVWVIFDWLPLYQRQWYTIDEGHVDPFVTSVSYLLVS